MVDLPPIYGQLNEDYDTSLKMFPVLEAKTSGSNFSNHGAGETCYAFWDPGHEFKWYKRTMGHTFLTTIWAI